ncbi:LamG-like jellyroll fold domain-containing protein [Streptomyces sp. NPDC021012]|uniref:LamG-like jellyroll fold domain-containing protein n=1 Tax=Streptomyces sp. NPDC021012 TaxID=3365107 RepID=UPI003798A013
MFELVLHHRYDRPGAEDLSGRGNHGYGAPGRGEGREAGTGAALFDGTTDRVFVPPSPTLTRSGGIRADLTVNLEEYVHRRTLIEGYLSFALGVEGDGALGASIYQNMEWGGIQSRPGLVPLGRWVHVTFVYTDDGAMALTMDGELVAEGYGGLGPAQGIHWPFGLNIGAWPDGDQRMWKGRIEEVMLWRTAPNGTKAPL